MYVTKHFIRFQTSKKHWSSSKEYDSIEELDKVSLNYRKNHPGAIYMQRRVWVPDPEPAK